jgi:hypothetical protein
MSIEEKLDALIELLTSAKDDAAKCDNGKAGSPGTRLRKNAQEAKRTLDEIRRGVIEIRKV